MNKRLDYEQAPRPMVSVGILIWKDGKVLLGKRKGSHGAGQYAPPGGYFEYMESLVECARREVREETGMEIKNIKFLCLYNEKAYAQKHFVNIGFTAEWKSGEPVIRELEKCDSWDWYHPDKLPAPAFANLSSYIESFKTKKNFYDA